jgi:hypothetical protein
MTVSANDRRDAVRRALIWLAEECGDQKSIRFGEQELAPAGPLRTTIVDLKDAGYIKQVAQFGSSATPFLLTIEGWFKAQEVSGRFASAEFDERRGRLCAALKSFIDGRHAFAIVHIDHVVAKCGLPFDFVWNMLEARVLPRLDPKGRFDVGFENRNVRIEPTFGQEPIDL